MTFQSHWADGPPDTVRASQAIWEATGAITEHGITTQELERLLTAVLDQAQLGNVLGALAMGAESQSKRFLDQTELAVAWKAVAGLFESMSSFTLPEER